MKLRILFLCAAAALAPLARADSGQLKSYIGWIPVQPVTAGEFLDVDMHRFYFKSPGSAEMPVVTVPPDAKCTVTVDPATFFLRIAMAEDASGLVDIPMQVILPPEKTASGIGRKNAGATQAPETAAKPLLEAVVTCAVQPRDGYVFTYRPGGAKPARVFVAGQFNGWNTSSHELRKEPGGTYKLFVPLRPGSYQYKLVVDGKWLQDTANADEADDGQGSVNSVARVVAADRGSPPAIFARAAERKQLTFTIVPGGSEIIQVSTVLELPDGNSRAITAKRNGNSVLVDASSAPPGSWVRAVIADAKGNVSKAARAPVSELSSFQWQDGIIYYAFVDRFANGDEENDKPVADPDVAPPSNYMGGDYRGIRKKIDEGYFAKLGVNVLWLSPLNRNPDTAWQEYLPPYRHYSGYHGYWPVSHNEVEPRFGGEGDLAELVEAAHGNGMYVLADLVLKHVHKDHPLYKEHPELFGSLQLPDGSKNLRRFDEHQFTTWFEECLPAFDFSNPETTKFLVGNAIDFAARFKLDGYRLDAVKHIPQSFWWRYRTALRTAIDPARKTPTYSVGETFMDRQGIMSFVGPDMLDGQFDFPLYDTIIDVFAKQKSGMDELERSLSASELVYGKETLMSPLIGNHDKPRFMAYADGDLPDPSEPDEEEIGWKKPPRVDDPAAYERLKMALTFLMAIDGVPMVYYGDEIGMSGAGDPDNRRMMRWGADVGTAEESVRAHLARVTAFRTAHPALRYGNRRALVADGGRYAFVRAHLGDSVLAVWNRGPHLTEFALDVAPELPDGVYADALSGREIEVSGGKASFKLEPAKSALFAPKGK